MLTPSIGIYAILEKGYDCLLLKDDNRLWQDEILHVLEDNYYSLVFNDNSYVISRHIKSACSYGVLANKYHVLSVAIPRGWYLENWQLAFEQLEQILISAFERSEDVAKCKAILHSENILEESTSSWILKEDKEQFLINFSADARKRKALLKYTGSEELNAYFCDPCRRSFEGFGTIYLAESTSTQAERFISTKLSEIKEPAQHNRCYSITMECYDGENKLGEVPVYPSVISALEDTISAQIHIPYYAVKSIKRSLADHWDEWQVKKDQNGMGYTIAVALTAEECHIQLECAELERQKVCDYSLYVRVNIGVIQGKEIILKGREIGEKVTIRAIQKDQGIKILLNEKNKLIKFQLNRFFILKDDEIAKDLERIGLVVTGVELYYLNNKRKRDVGLNNEIYLPGHPVDYYLKFKSDYHEDYKLPVHKLKDRPLPEPVLKNTTTCFVTIEGEYIDAILKRYKQIIVKYKIKDGADVTKLLEEKFTHFFLEIPKGKTLICTIILKGCKPKQVEVACNETKVIKLEVTALRKFLYGLWNMIRKKAGMFMLELLLVSCLSECYRSGNTYKLQRETLWEKQMNYKEP